MALAVAATGWLSSCTSYDWTNTHDTELTEFEITTGDVTYDAADADAEDLVIEWTPSRTNDHTLVFYKVIFATKADMSDVYYELESLNFGTETNVEISPSELNIIAELGGIPQDAEGTVYWTVKANTGVTDMQSDEVHKLTINRPDGFAYNPEHLFLETPSGEFITMKLVDFGRFEIFTTLSEGEYKITERMAGGKTRNFSVSGDKLIPGGTIHAPKGGTVTHILADFNTSEGTLATVNSVSLLYLGDAQNPVELPLLAGNDATWQGTYHFTRVGNTYTYKFIVNETNTEGDTRDIYFGYLRSNAQSQTANTPADYFDLYRCADAGTSFCFRFGNANNFQIDHDLLITVDLNNEGELDNYKHTVEVL